jgi:hypothetical protein
MSGWYVAYLIACFVNGWLIGEYVLPDIGLWQCIVWFLVPVTAYIAGLENGKGR